MGTPDEGVLERVVEVTGVTNNLNKDTLRDFFEIEKRSGGKDVQRLVTLPKWETAWVKFPTAEVADRVRWKGAEPHPFRVVETELGVSTVSVLVISPVTQDEEHLLTEYFKSEVKEFGSSVKDLFYDYVNEALYIHFRDTAAVKRVLFQKHKIGNKHYKVMIPTEVYFDPKTTGHQSEEQEFRSLSNWGQTGFSQITFSSMIPTSSISKRTSSYRTVTANKENNVQGKTTKKEGLGAKPKVIKKEPFEKSQDYNINKDEEMDDIFEDVTVTVNVDFLPRLTRELDDFRALVKQEYGITLTTDQDGKHCLKGPFDATHRIGKALAAGKFLKFQYKSGDDAPNKTQQNKKNSSTEKLSEIDGNDLKAQKQTVQQDDLENSSGQGNNAVSKKLTDVQRSKRKHYNNDSNQQPESTSQDLKNPPVNYGLFPVDALCWKFLCMKLKDLIKRVEKGYQVSIKENLGHDNPHISVSGSRSSDAKRYLYSVYEKMKKIFLSEYVSIEKSHCIPRIEEEILKLNKESDESYILELRTNEPIVCIGAVEKRKLDEVKTELFSNLGIPVEDKIQARRTQDKTTMGESRNEELPPSETRREIRKADFQVKQQETNPQRKLDSDDINVQDTMLHTFNINPLSWRLFKCIHFSSIRDICSNYKVSISESYSGKPHIEIKGDNSNKAKHELWEKYVSFTKQLIFDSVDLKRFALLSEFIEKEIKKIQIQFIDHSVIEFDKDSSEVNIIATDKDICAETKKRILDICYESKNSGLSESVAFLGTEEKSEPTNKGEASPPAGHIKKPQANIVSSHDDTELKKMENKSRKNVDVRSDKEEVQSTEQIKEKKENKKPSKANSDTELQKDFIVGNNLTTDMRESSKIETYGDSYYDKDDSKKPESVVIQERESSPVFSQPGTTSAFGHTKKYPPKPAANQDENLSETPEIRNSGKAHAEGAKEEDDGTVPVKEVTENVPPHEEPGYVDGQRTNQGLATPVVLYESNLTYGLKVKIIQGDITKIEADVIVNDANNNLENTFGIAGAISKAAGPEMDKQCQALIKKHGSCSAKNVVVTTAGRLEAGHVLHVVSPVCDKSRGYKACLSDLKSTFYDMFMKADEVAASSLAIPEISSGGFKPMLIAKALYDTIEDIGKDEKKYCLESVFIVLDNQTSGQYFCRVFQNKGVMKSSHFGRRGEESNSKQDVTMSTSRDSPQQDLEKKSSEDLYKRTVHETGEMKSKDQEESTTDLSETCQKPVRSTTQMSTIPSKSEGEVNPPKDRNTGFDSKKKEVTQKAPNTIIATYQECDICLSKTLQCFVISNCIHIVCEKCLKFYSKTYQSKCPKCGLDDSQKNISTDICTLCNMALNEPVKLSKCNHIFCRKCIYKKFKIFPFCPVCQAYYPNGPSEENYKEGAEFTSGGRASTQSKRGYLGKEESRGHSKPY